MLSSIGAGSNMSSGGGNGGFGYPEQIEESFNAVVNSPFAELLKSFLFIKGLEQASPFAAIFNFQSVGLAALGKLSPMSFLPKFTMAGLNKNAQQGH